MVFGDTDVLLTQALSRKTAGLSPCYIHVFLESIIVHVAMTLHFALACPPKKTPCSFLVRTIFRTFVHPTLSGYNGGVVKRFTVAEFQGRSANIWSSVWTKPWTVRKIPGPGGPKHRSDENPRNRMAKTHGDPKKQGKFGKITPFQSFTCRVSSSFLGWVFFSGSK